MSIQQRIRNWLGITEILIEHETLSMKCDRLHTKLDKAQLTLNAIGPGLGRVIAKLDTEYAKSEFDPAKRAESDKIADEVIKRLHAEAKAQEPYNHD